MTDEEISEGRALHAAARGRWLRAQAPAARTAPPDAGRVAEALARSATKTREVVLEDAVLRIRDLAGGIVYNIKIISEEKKPMKTWKCDFGPESIESEDLPSGWGHLKITLGSKIDEVTFCGQHQTEGTDKIDKAFREIGKLYK